MLTERLMRLKRDVAWRVIEASSMTNLRVPHWLFLVQNWIES